MNGVTAAPIAPPPRTRPAPTRPVEYTVDELAKLVGMSARNIRAHQARRLLPPPTRKGRVAVYDDSHAQRLEAIKALQRQGFNLASIEAILGPRSTHPGLQAMSQVLERLATDRPTLVYALGRHNVVARGEHGAVQVSQPRAVRAALGMHRVGVPAPSAIGLLGELLDSMRGVAQELVRCTCTRTFALLPQGSGERGPASWDELDRDALAITEGVVAVLIEAFRVAVENSAKDVVADLLTERAGPEMPLHVVAELDNG